MLPIEAIELVMLGLAASLIGSMLGIGGGLIIVPILTVFGVPIHTAIGASLVTVITTSTVTGSMESRAELTNVRLAMLLEIATTIGAIAGAFVSLMLGLQELAVIMFVVLFILALRMRHPDPGSEIHPSHVHTGLHGEQDKPDKLATRLGLPGFYHDESLGKDVAYGVTKTHVGFSLSVLAGAISGLLGVGGGIIKVPAMTGIMRVPIKVASATSNLMIGVTACASASVFYMHGSIDALLTAMLMLGVVPGSALGMRLARRTPRAALRQLFIAVLMAAAVLMLLKGFGVIP